MRLIGETKGQAYYGGEIAHALEKFSKENGGSLTATETFTLSSNRGITLGADSTVTVASGKTLTYTGVMIMAAQQTLSLASAEGELS